ncbi:MAG TPA: hypothetical protein VMF58_06980 [Rhizomicrobium sp.]|nr:hypothetical protein [Rhizomicrobium sp.]
MTAPPTLTPDQLARIDAVCERHYAIADGIGARFTAAYERLLRDDPAAVHDRRRGYVDKDGAVNFKSAPVKYAIDARTHMSLKMRYLPYLKDSAAAFDIGVGTGQMFQLLRDALGIPVTGIDSPGAEGALLYEAFRDALGIPNDVASFDVTAGVDVPVPRGATVLCLWPIFDRGWRVDEHAWFMDMCRRRGAERVIWRFNMLNAPEAILNFYRDRIGASAPRDADPGFLIAPL